VIFFDGYVERVGRVFTAIFGALPRGDSFLKAVTSMKESK
jgi:hypothetical protein